jgi:hypothetical protein
LQPTIRLQLQTATRLSGWQEQKPKSGADKKMTKGSNKSEPATSFFKTSKTSKSVHGQTKA